MTEGEYREKNFEILKRLGEKVRTKTNLIWIPIETETLAKVVNGEITDDEAVNEIIERINQYY